VVTDPDGSELVCGHIGLQLAVDGVRLAQREGSEYGLQQVAKALHILFAHNWVVTVSMSNSGIGL